MFLCRLEQLLCNHDYTIHIHVNSRIYPIRKVSVKCQFIEKKNKKDI